MEPFFPALLYEFTSSDFLGKIRKKFHYFEKDGKKMKDCTDCTFPHRPENYDQIIQVLKE